jgi:hypothetical protein
MAEGKERSSGGKTEHSSRCPKTFPDSFWDSKNRCPKPPSKRIIGQMSKNPTPARQVLDALALAVEDCLPAKMSVGTGVWDTLKIEFRDTFWPL